MTDTLYPLKFEPIYQYRLWGGRRLTQFLSKPLPNNELIGEAWLLSDRKDHSNKVVEGLLKGLTLTELMMRYPKEIMGKVGNNSTYFPLLLKFLDCSEVLSVQVHPSDNQKEYIRDGDSGKTEAWVVLETNKESLIYAGLKEGTNKEDLLNSIEDKTVFDKIHSFVPKVGDAVFIKSGTVHTLSGTVVFEVQENSDVTFRLYDWERIDPKTGIPRDLQVHEAVACIDFNQVNIGPVTPVKSRKVEQSEMLFDNKHFKLWRINSNDEFTVGFKDEPAILVCIEGKGLLEHNEGKYAISKGEVVLLPAITGQLNFHPEEHINLLQIAIPDKSKIKH